MFRYPFLLVYLWCLFATSSAAETFHEKLVVLQQKLASDPTNTFLLFKLGDLCHDEGAKDNREAVKLADKYLTILLALDTNNAMGRALYGSVLTMKARDAFWPPTRLAHVKEGNQQMDAAVKLAPLDLRVRFVRADNNYHMPKWLKREEMVQTDFAWLWDQIKAKPAVLDTEAKQLVSLRQGQLLKKQKQTSEAIKIWQQGLTYAPDSSTAKEIQKELIRVGNKR